MSTTLYLTRDQAAVRDLQADRFWRLRVIGARRRGTAGEPTPARVVAAATAPAPLEVDVTEAVHELADVPVGAGSR
jgi:hypothetical protein